ncbi:MAG TPA: high-affinity nickel-transport family protein [Myxococcota bacterium]|nr:high-affinity nickel-transport family protein [Myxococcota bacterium]
MLTAAILGFLLGLRHASDPDHVVAISTIVAHHRSAWAASRVGVAWGLGHSLTIVAVGGAVVALGLALPPRLGLGLELLVGVVLVALGVSNLRSASAGGLAHAASSAHRHGASVSPLGRAFFVGLVHGLAGSAAVAILALAAMPGPAAAIVYLAIFSLGTIVGMVAISLGVGAPLALASGRSRVQRWIVAGSGALSLGLGLWLVWKIGVVEGILL